MEKAPLKNYNTQANKPQKRQWYRETDNLHQLVFEAVERIERSQTQRALNNSKYLTLYENLTADIPGLLRPLQATFGSKLSFNVIRSCIDTAASKIAASKPRPEYNTANADYRLRRTAENLTQYLDGVYYDNKTYAQMQDAFIDAVLWGTGVIQVYAAGNEIKHERVRIDEILVDDYEGQYRKPQNMYHARAVFRDWLLAKAESEQWDAQAIEAIKQATPDADMVKIVEAWHLPTKTKDGKLQGGRHVVAIQNYTLQQDEWRTPEFPFAFYRWSNKRVEFYGSGLAEELIDLQYEIAQVLKHIARHMRQSGLKIVIQTGSGINPAALTNVNMPVIEADGEPTALTFPPVHPDTYQYLENLIRKAYELTGISVAQASATREKGITSNAGLETLNDMQTERFMLNQQRFEQFSSDIAHLTAVFASDLYGSQDNSETGNSKGDSKGGSEETAAKPATPNSWLVKQIRFGELELDGSTYQLQIFPVAAFSMSPAARLQKIQDWMQAGALSGAAAIQLMGDNPDYREWQSLQTASRERVQKYLDLMKHDSAYNPPDQYLDPIEAFDLATAEINRSIIQEVPEHRIQLMRDFRDACQALQASASQPPAPPSSASAPAPLGQPAPPPTSPMLPFQAGT